MSKKINWSQFSSHYKRFSVDEIIIRQENPPLNLYILVEGLLYAYRNGTFISSITKEGEYFGEISILMNKPHSATVRAHFESLVIEIPIKEVERFLTQSPEVAISLARNLAERLAEQNSQLVRAITDPLISLQEKKKTESKADAALDLYRLNSFFKDFRPNVEVINQGKNPKALYILVTGQVEIIKNGKTIAIEGSPGYYMGDVSILRDTVANATVKTTEKTTMIEIPVDKVDSFLRHSPEIAISMAKKLAERIIAINDEYLNILEAKARATLPRNKKNFLDY
jgi:CRP-like cAMP-binding protein